MSALPCKESFAEALKNFASPLLLLIELLIILHGLSRSAAFRLHILKLTTVSASWCSPVARSLAGTLQSTGKTVSSGKVKEVSPMQLLGAAALSYKDRQKQAHVRGCVSRSDAISPLILAVHAL